MPPDFEHWHHHHHGFPPGMYGPDAFGADPFGVLGPVLVALLLVFVVVATLWSMGYTALMMSDRPRDRARLAARTDWDDAVRRHTELAVEYARFECDAGAVLALPALADVRQAPTARFVDTFAEACALLTERFPGTAFAQRFAAAVEHEERAWTAAMASAERLRDSRFDPDDQVLLDQVRTLLEVAEASPFEPERRTALRTALRRLRQLERRSGWHLPRPAVLAVEERARGMLVAAPQAS
jgi:hypothetical protein